MTKKTSQIYKQKPDIIDKNGEIIRLFPLTKMETKIAKLVVGRAMSNNEIADELGKSVRTIENQRHSLMRKLKTKNAVELTKKVINMGLAKL
jgi:DNA-binding NarL/FixJ family response regulator